MMSYDITTCKCNRIDKVSFSILVSRMWYSIPRLLMYFSSILYQYLYCGFWKFYLHPMRIKIVFPMRQHVSRMHMGDKMPCVSLYWLSMVEICICAMYASILGWYYQRGLWLLSPFACVLCCVLFSYHYHLYLSISINISHVMFHRGVNMLLHAIYLFSLFSTQFWFFCDWAACYLQAHQRPIISTLLARIDMIYTRLPGRDEILHHQYILLNIAPCWDVYCCTHHRLNNYVRVHGSESVDM